MKRLSLTTPHLLVMVGTPGAGKSFFARQFSKTFIAPIVSHDDIRTAISTGSPSYDKNESGIVNKIADNQLNQLLLTKSTIIVDGGSDTRTERQEVARKARANGYRALFIWVQTDPITSKKRAINGIRGQSKPEELLTPQQYESAMKRFTAPNSSEPVLVISGKHTYATQAKIVLKKLSEPRAAEIQQRIHIEERNDPPSPRVSRIHIS